MPNLSSEKIQRTFIWLGIFSIAMAFLEAVVVVYLRQLYYPQGFGFPMSPLTSQTIFVEWIREIATIIMLVSVGTIAGKNHLQKFCYFLYSFGVWDIFYYVGLKLLLDWPSSFLTWDILFLIPVTWIGPVLAPVICSFTMILFAGIIIYLQQVGYNVKIKLTQWVLILSGAFTIFYTFIWDFTRIIIQEGLLSDFWNLADNEHFQQIISQYIPTYYNWYLFAFGEILILVALTLIYRRTKSISTFITDHG